MNSNIYDLEQQILTMQRLVASSKKELDKFKMDNKINAVTLPRIGEIWNNGITHFVVQIIETNSAFVRFIAVDGFNKPIIRSSTEQFLKTFERK